MRGSNRPVGRFLVVLFVAVLTAASAVTAAEAPTAADAPTAGAADAAAGPGGAPLAAKGAKEPEPPVRISADTAEFFNKENLVVFTGNVVAIQADSTLTADSMEVTFSQPETPAGQPAAAVAGPSSPRRITKIVALGNVRFRQVDPGTKKERYSTGGKGVYEAGPRIVTMTGSPRVWEGKSVIVGEEIVFHLEDKKVVVNGKVNLTVFPDEAQEAKKP